MERVVIYTPSAPSHGKARGYVSNKNIWILRVPEGWSGTIRSPKILGAVSIATEVDSRYTGPRSAYGKAMAEAEGRRNRWAARLAKNSSEGPIRDTDYLDFVG